MNDARFNVVFCGETVPGQTPQVVKQNLAAAFKLSDVQLQELFTGKTIFIKKGVNHQTALQYQQLFNKYGAMCHIEPVSATTPGIPPPPQEQAGNNSSPEYRVILTGALAEGKNLSEVQRQIAATFKTNEAAIETLLTGKPVVIKDRLDRQRAQQYRAALERCGAVCRIEPPIEVPATDEQAPSSPPPSSALPRCPKCHYQATTPDDMLITGMGGAGECPSCGIIVAKYQKIEQQKAEYEDPALQRQRDKILAVLREYLPHASLFVAPDIPQDKLLNARQSCLMPVYEQPVALVDCTVLGSARDGIIFAMKGIYYHSAWSGNNLGAGMISYQEFAAHPFTIATSEIVRGEKRFFNCGACRPEFIASLLNSIRSALFPETAPAADTSGIRSDVPVARAAVPAETKPVRDKSFFAPEKKGLEKGMIGGIAMMIIAAVWFAAGYRAGVIFFYPPILFVIGLFGFLKGLMTGNLAGYKAILILTCALSMNPSIMHAEAQDHIADGARAVTYSHGVESGRRGSVGQTVYVHEIKFNWGAGSTAIGLKERWDGSDYVIDAPEYIRNGINKPAAYVKNTTLSVQARFEADTPLNEVTIWAEGSFGGLASQKVDFGGTGSSSYVTFTAPRKLPDRVGITSVAWKWKYRDSTGITRDMGKSSHVIYTAHKTPLHTPVYRELMEWTCDWATDAKNEKQIADSVIRKLSRSGLQYGKAAWTTGDILDTGGGMCGGWSAMFADMMGAQGVYAPNRCFILQADAAAAPEIKWECIVIKAPGLNRREPAVDVHEWRDVNRKSAYPDPVYAGDSSRADDVRYAAEKRYAFFSPYDGHCINFLQYNGKVYLYDPSFGGGPYNNTFTSIPSGSMSGTALDKFRKNYHDRAIDHMGGVVGYRECASCAPKVDTDLLLTIRTRGIPALLDPAKPETFQIHYLWD